MGRDPAFGHLPRRCPERRFDERSDLGHRGLSGHRASGLRLLQIGHTRLKWMRKACSARRHVRRYYRDSWRLRLLISANVPEKRADGWRSEVNTAYGWISWFRTA